MDDILLLAADEEVVAVCYWCKNFMFYDSRTDTHRCRHCKNAYQGEALRPMKARPQQAL